PRPICKICRLKLFNGRINSKGFVITDKGFGNFKLPVMYLAMFMPLLFGGAGRLSMDYVINSYLRKRK
ncbi:MAG TPA: hypothetical protein PK517_01005, partial [Nitrosomonas sp.]|nr:hypothetical protein [Nitrosomonas sp.]